MSPPSEVSLCPECLVCSKVYTIRSHISFLDFAGLYVFDGKLAKVDLSL